MSYTNGNNESYQDDRPGSSSMHTRNNSSLGRFGGSSSIATTGNAFGNSSPRHADSNTTSSRSQSQAFPHCSFCMVAEFDIDKGSTLSYQYPAPSGHDEHMLAELMLPDGVHARSEDWTIFFLPDYERDGGKKPTSPTAPGDETNGERRRRDNLYYVLNLVRTKHDTSVRRGALVKAVAIVTRHPFIQIFKPALLLALDEYFRAPGLDVLIRLFDALNSLDLSLMPNFTRNEKIILRGTDRRDLFEERFALASRSMINLRPLAGMTGGAGASAATAMTPPPSALDDEEKMRESHDSPASASRSRSRTVSDSSSFDELSGHQQHPSQSTSSRRNLPNRPSIASLRLASNNAFLKRKQSSAALTPDGGTPQGHTSSAASANTRSASISNQALPAHAMNKVKDTHVWETTVSYGKILDLPIRVPTDVFDEEVGEYSLVHLINTFGASTPTGPQHPHLHTNGHLTHPIILLFNAAVTGKRIIFLGHNQPANHVAGHVLSLCALATGCGTGWRGVVQRCFPYANLIMIDELEHVPGYIAGVTNPRFEELHCWDVLCNIESGRITIAKDIEPATPLRPTGGPSLSGTFASSTGYSAGIGPDGETRLSRAPSEPDVSFNSSNASQPSAGGNATANGAVGGTAARGRDRQGSTFEARHDAPENIFMEELMLAITARYGERYVRARMVDYAAHFLRLAARHEEYYYGQTSIAPPSQPFLNGQLGSGAVFVDRETELKKIQVNAMRIEGWRATESYALHCADETSRDRRKDIADIDVGHQLARLRRAKKMPSSEAALIFSTLVRGVRSPDQIVELLALMPARHGAMLPLSNGLFHPLAVVRSAATELLLRIASHPVGRRLMQTLNLFHRIAFARLLHDSPTPVAASNGQERHTRNSETGSGAVTPVGSVPHGDVSAADSSHSAAKYAADQHRRHAPSRSLALPSANHQQSGSYLEPVSNDARMHALSRSASPAA